MLAGRPSRPRFRASFVAAHRASRSDPMKTCGRNNNPRPNGTGLSATPGIKVPSIWGWVEACSPVPLGLGFSHY
jgi:hypothetical protein